MAVVAVVMVVTVVTVVMVMFAAMFGSRDLLLDNPKSL